MQTVCPDSGGQRQRRTQEMTLDYFKLILLGLITLFAAIAADWGRDLAYQVHALLIMVVAASMFIWTLRRMDEPARAAIVISSDED